MDLRRSAISGVRWTGMTTVYTLGLQFAQVAVLAHALSHGAFGLVGLVMVSVGFGQAFSDLGLTQAIVQRQDGDDRPLSSLFWLILSVGAALTGLFYFLAPYTASMLLPASGPLIDVGPETPVTSEDLAALLAGVAPVFLAGTLGHIPAALHQRALRFGRVTVLEAAAQTTGSAVTITCALSGLGAFSIVYGLLTGAATRSIVMASSAWPFWRPGLRARRADLSGYVKFGLYQTGERAVNFLAGNLDYVIIASFLGPVAVGVYYAAYQVVILPIQKMSPVLTRVAFPVFARVQNDDATLRKGYTGIARLIGLVGFPALVGLGVTAPVAIPLFLGGKWASAVPLAQILVPVGFFKSLGSPLGSIFLAKGRADLGLKWNLGLAMANAALFSAVASRGTHAVAMAHVLTSGCVMLAGQVMLKRLIGLEVGTYLTVLVRPLFMSVTMGILVLLAIFGMAGVEVSGIHLMLFLVTLGVSAYLLLALKVERDLLEEIRGWLLTRD